MAAHYHQRVTANAVAKACGLTRFEFSRRFREAFKTTFRDYLIRFRIAEARRLLTEGRVSITGIAYSVGFNDGSHFARMFRRFTGVLPSQFTLEPPPELLAGAASFGSDAGLRRRADRRRVRLVRLNRWGTRGIRGLSLTVPARNPTIRRLCDGAIAQLGERLHGMQEVDGSIPSGSTIFRCPHRLEA